MNIRKISSVFAIFVILWTMFFSVTLKSEDTVVYDYEISAIYEYQNTLNAVDIIKNRDFSGEGNVLLLAVKEGDLTVRAKAVPIDNLPVGTNEISIYDLAIADNQTVFVTVWNSIDDIKPLTNGTIPEITKEENRITGNEEEWTVSKNGKRITAYIGNETEVEIPNYLGGKHITEIAPPSTADNMISIFGDRAEEITAFTIPNGIKLIGPTAFFGCVNAESELYLPECLNYIGLGAFYNCTKMTGDIVIPEGIETIPPLTFYNCQGLSGNITLPRGLDYIGDYSFYNCTGLTGDLTIPDNVLYLGNYAFTFCGNLKGNLSLGGVTHIGDAALANCGFTGSLILPEGLTYIGWGAFQECIGFKNELVLPSTLEHIGDAAFNKCMGFSNEVLTIPASVKTLGGDLRVEENTCYSSHLFYLFGTAARFTAFEVEKGSEYFCAEDGVLYNIDKTRLIAYPRGKTDEVFEIPEGVTQIDELSLARCMNIKEVILPDSYIISEEVPANVINQDGNSLALAFYSYSTVERVSVKDTNENYTSKNGILYSKDGKSLWYCPVSYSGEVIIPNGTERIERGAFYGKDGEVLYTSLHIPESVNYINSNALLYINRLLKRNITIAEGNEYFTVTDGTIKAVN